MNLEEYQRMHEAEQAMWWYRGLHANLLAFLDQDEATSAGPILDAGCGTGGFLRGLLAAHPELRGDRHGY